jgi:hypothetical protein
MMRLNSLIIGGRYETRGKIIRSVSAEKFNPSTLELNHSGQHSLTKFFNGDFAS